jgi:hypothetical protein
LESQFTNAGGMQIMGRFNNMDGFASGNEFNDDRDQGGMTVPGQSQRITVNLEDAVLEEQKLF